MALAKNGTGLDHEEAYTIFRFLLGVTIAHELVHCFMNFLSKTEEKDTPINTLGMSLTNTGPWSDSGTLWESLTLGGTVVAFKVSNHPLRRRQAGIPWLFVSDRHLEQILFRTEKLVRGDGMLLLLMSLRNWLADTAG